MSNQSHDGHYRQYFLPYDTHLGCIDAAPEVPDQSNPQMQFTQTASNVIENIAQYSPYALNSEEQEFDTIMRHFRPLESQRVLNGGNGNIGQYHGDVVQQEHQSRLRCGSCNPPSTKNFQLDHYPIAGSAETSLDQVTEPLNLFEGSSVENQYNTAYHREPLPLTTTQQLLQYNLDLNPVSKIQEPKPLSFESQYAMNSFGPEEGSGQNHEFMSFDFDNTWEPLPRLPLSMVVNYMTVSQAQPAGTLLGAGMPVNPFPTHTCGIYPLHNAFLLGHSGLSTEDPHWTAIPDFSNAASQFTPSNHSFYGLSRSSSW